MRLMFFSRKRARQDGSGLPTCLVAVENKDSVGFPCAPADRSISLDSGQRANSVWNAFANELECTLTLLVPAGKPSFFWRIPSNHEKMAHSVCWEKWVFLQVDGLEIRLADIDATIDAASTGLHRTFISLNLLNES